MAQEIDTINVGGKFKFDDIYGYKGPSGGNPDLDMDPELSSPMSTITLDRRSNTAILERGFEKSVSEALSDSIIEKCKRLKGILTGLQRKYVQLFRRDLRTIGYTETQLTSEADVLGIVGNEYKAGGSFHRCRVSVSTITTPQGNINKNYGEYLAILNLVDTELAVSDPSLSVHINHPSFASSERFNDRTGTKLTEDRVTSAARIIMNKIVELDYLELQGLPRLVRTNVVLGALSLFIVTGNFGARPAPFKEVFANRSSTEETLVAKALSDFEKRLSGVPGLTGLSKDLAKFGTSVDNQQSVVAAAGSVDSLRYNLASPLYNLFRSTNNRLGMSVNPEDNPEITDSKINAYMKNPTNKAEFLSYYALYNSGGVEGLKPYEFNDSSSVTVTLPDNPDLVLKLILKQFGNAIRGEKDVFDLEKREIPASANRPYQYAQLLKLMYENPAYKNEIEKVLDTYFGITTAKVTLGSEPPERNIITTDLDLKRRKDVYEKVANIIKQSPAENLAKGIDQYTK